MPKPTHPTGTPGAALYAYVHESLSHGADPDTLRDSLTEIQEQASLLLREIQEAKEREEREAKARKEREAETGADARLHDRIKRPHARSRMLQIHTKARAFDLLSAASPTLAAHFLERARAQRSH